MQHRCGFYLEMLQTQLFVGIYLWDAGLSALVCAKSK